MAITFGSLRHTPSGRKRKPLPKAKKRVTEWKPYEAPKSYRRETPDYPSFDDKSHNTRLVEKPQLDSKYTIAPAYNKGAYQVISKENVKDIGR
jgi:hypothetical protein